MSALRKSLTSDSEEKNRQRISCEYLLDIMNAVISSFKVKRNQTILQVYILNQCSAAE